MLSLPLSLYTEKSNKGGVVRAQLASCASASGRGHGRPHAGMHETKGMAGQPCPPCIVDPTKLKYLAVTVMTAASTVLAKSVRFLEHVSPGCCAGIASIVPVSWSA